MLERLIKSRAGVERVIYVDGSPGMIQLVQARWQAMQQAGTRWVGAPASQQGRAGRAGRRRCGSPAPPGPGSGSGEAASLGE